MSWDLPNQYNKQEVDGGNIRNYQNKQNNG